MRLYTVLFLCCFGFTTQAETAPPENLEKIKLLDTITTMPDTFWDTLKFSFSKESIPVWATIVGTTAVLYHYDEDLYNGARNDGGRWGIGTEDHTKTVIHAFGFDVLRLPSDTGSTLYFLGDGWTHLMIAAGFFVDGAITGDARPYNTGLEIVHGMVVSTIFSQALKRAAGRESPNNATQDRGKWRPFPSIAAYQAKTAMYDAFPSGHIMTASLAFTVINTNYPEYFWYLAPVETVWLIGLGFEMVNNGVHWASDYPLGLGIGYAVGKMSANLGRSHKPDTSGKAEKAAWNFFPSFGPEGPEMNAMYSF